MNLDSGLKVYVPNKIGRSSLGFIHAGSAIVSKGFEDSEGYIEVYYEGNIYGASNIRSFEDKASHAADRLAKRYPTIARRKVLKSHLTEVGEFQTETKPAMSSASIPPELRHHPRSVVAKMLPSSLRKELTARHVIRCVVKNRCHPDFMSWVQF